MKGWRPVTRLALLFLAPTGAFAADGDMASTVRAALAHSAAAGAAREAARAADADANAAAWRTAPHVAADVTAERGDTPVYVFGSLLSQRRFASDNFAIDSLNRPGDLTNVRSALTVGVPVFTGFDLTAARRAAGFERRAAEAECDGAGQRVRLETAEVWIDALRAGETVEILDGRLRDVNDELSDAARLRERGVVLGSDYHAALAIGARLRSWRVRAAGERSAALARLSVLTGSEAPSVHGRLTEPAYAPLEREDLVRAAVDGRPDLRAARARSGASEVTARQEGRALLPRVDAFASVETDSRDFSSNPSNHRYGVSARVPFGDATVPARRRAAGARARAARLSVSAIEDGARSDVAAADEAYRSAVAALPLAREASVEAAKSLSLFRPLYRAGRQSILDVLRAEEATARAETDRRETIVAAHLAQLRRLYAAGLLDDAAVTRVSDALGETP